MIPHAILDEGNEISGVLNISSIGLAFDSPAVRRVRAVLLLATREMELKLRPQVLAAFATAFT